MTYERVLVYLLGVATMAILWAGTAYTSPVQRCVGEQGTAWVGAPVAKCYQLRDLWPENAFTPVR